jgi:hypothetical protein
MIWRDNGAIAMPTGSDTDAVSLPAYYDIEKQKKKTNECTIYPDRACSK